jgi:opine dehydrogenase
MRTEKRSEPIIMNRKANSPVAVVGGGYGGLAIAGELSLTGRDVRLFEFPEFADSIAPVRAAGGVNITGQGVEPVGFARLPVITHDIAEAVRDASVIFVVLPAFAHDKAMELLVPVLRQGQTVVVCTGYWSGLKYGAAVAAQGAVLAENAIFVYASRRVGPTEIFIDGVKSEIPVAAYDRTKTPAVVEQLATLYPQMKAASSVFETSLNSPNPMLHPPIAVLNIGHIEMKQKGFSFYVAGVSKKVGAAMDVLDAERLKLAKALGVPNVVPVVDWMKRFYGSYGASGSTTYEVIQSNRAYSKIVWDFPFVLRYIDEDVPFGLVPLSGLGRLLDVKTPMIDGLIAVSCAVQGKDYWSTGTTVKRMGLAGRSAAEIRKLVAG